MILKGFKLIDEKGQDARFEYLDEFVTASFYAGIAFLKAGCGPVHGMSFPWAAPIMFLTASPTTCSLAPSWTTMTPTSPTARS